MSKRAIAILLGIAADIVLLLVLIINVWATREPGSTTHTTAIIPSPTETIIPSLTPTPTLLLTPTAKPKITFTPTPTPAFTMQTSSPQTNFDELFAKYGAQYGVDPEKLKSIASCESGFDPNQVTGIYGGLFQFSSLAWSEARGRIGLDATDSLRFNAEESIRTAAHEIQIKGTSGWSDCD